MVEMCNYVDAAMFLGKAAVRNCLTNPSRTVLQMNGYHAEKN